MTLPSTHEVLDPVPVPVPEDTKYIGDILERILIATREANSRREEPAPSVITMPFTARSTRLRCEYIVIAVDGAATVQFRVGTSVRHTFIFGAADTKVFPIYENIEQGQDVSVTPSAGAAYAYILGYVESDPTE